MRTLIQVIAVSLLLSFPVHAETLDERVEGYITGVIHYKLMTEQDCSVKPELKGVKTNTAARMIRERWFSFLTEWRRENEDLGDREMRLALFLLIHDAVCAKGEPT